MTNLRKTIVPKSDQLNADDFIAGPMTVRITDVREASGESPIAISFEGDGGKPYKPCKSMRRVMVMLWGEEGKTYIGKSMTLYRDPKVKFGGDEVGGIRISHMSDITEKKEMALTATRGSRKPFTVRPLVASNIAASPQQSAPTTPDMSLKEEGDAAAERGTAILKAFWERLKAPQQKPLAQFISEWKRRAEEVDAAPAEEEPLPEESQRLANAFRAG